MVIANACPNNNQSFERRMSYTYIYIIYNIFGLTESIFRIVYNFPRYFYIYVLLARLFGVPFGSYFEYKPADTRRNLALP